MRFASARILTSLFGYLDTIGVAPRDVADAASVAFIGKSSGAERIPARLAIEIRERCAVRLGEPLFGLEYAQALDPKTFGPISLFWRYAPSLRYSHRFSSRILHVHHEGVVVDLIVAGDEAALVYRMDPELRDGARQFVETNLSFALRICRWILGADWSPIRVAFAHEPIGPLGRYARILKAPVSFRAGEDALIFKAAELDRKSAGHDPELLAFVEGSLTAAAERVPLDFRERLDKNPRRSARHAQPPPERGGDGLGDVGPDPAAPAGLRRPVVPGPSARQAPADRRGGLPRAEAAFACAAGRANRLFRRQRRVAVHPHPSASVWPRLTFVDE